MDTDERIEAACELFQKLANVLHHEFHDVASAQRAQNECMAINMKIMELGFVAFTDITDAVQIIQPLNDTVQTVLILTYHMILIPNRVPIEYPIAVARAVLKAFAPPTVSEQHEPTNTLLSFKDEAWLHSILDNLELNGSGHDPSHQERN